MRAWSMGLALLSGLFGAAGVALAAIGAHRSADPTITTAAYFLLFHAPALATFSAVAAIRRAPLVLAAASLLAVGTILFSGELATRALSGVAPLPLAAPSGGIAMMFGWLVAAVALAGVLGSTQDP